MHTRAVCITSMLIGIILCACVPKAQYLALQNESRDQNLLAQKKIESLEAELKNCGESLGSIEADQQNSEEAKKKCQKDLSALQAQCALEKNINQQLSRNYQWLLQELNHKKSVIQLQEKVIRLLDDTKKTIETSLKDQIATQDIAVVELKDTLKVIFVDRILFDVGSTEITPKGKELLAMVAKSLKDDKTHNIVVEGHTDNVPVGSALKKRFPSNWELSTARAAAVVRFLQEEGGIQPEQLSARGYSFYRPVASNDTAEGRHRNRRIEIILGPAE